LGGAAIAALITYAVAQPITSQILTGLETWSISIGGPGGPSIFTTTAQMRNATGYSLQTSATASPIQATTLATRYIWNITVTGAVVLNAPANPFDGEMLEVVNDGAGAFTGAVTLTAAAGQTVVSGSTGALAQNGSTEWQYVTSTLTWYRLR
jgi:peroxiredoxin